MGSIVRSKCDLTVCALKDVIIVERAKVDKEGSIYFKHWVKVRKYTVCQKQPKSSSQPEECKVDKECLLLESKRCVVGQEKGKPVPKASDADGVDAARKVCTSE